MRRPDHAAAARQTGSIVVYLVVGLVAFGVLALAGASRYGATVTSALLPNCAVNARLMSEAGLRFATARLRACTDAACVNSAVTDISGKTYTVNAAKGLSFTLTTVSFDSASSTATVVSLGRGCAGVVSGVTASSSSSAVNLPQAAGTTTPGTAISFGNAIAGFTATQGFGGASGVTVDTTAKTVSLGNNLYTNSASVWYTGSNDVCTNGNCTLGSGLCAYWEFQFTDSSGDGYVWTIMSGDTNTSKSNGGNTGMGELLGYGGLGSSGLGIQPPKFGTEFDIYNNGCASSACSVGSRCDKTSADHIAYVFWGAESIGGCSSPTFDDNRHGAGAGNASQPENADNSDSSGTGTDGYYYRTGWGVGDDWMRSGDKYLFRYELERSTVADINGRYCYRIRSWVKKSGGTYAGLSDCSSTYSGTTPEMSQTFTLTKDVHDKLTKVFFGWTEGTGGATQLVTLSNFNLDFKTLKSPSAPSDYSAAWTFYETSGNTAHDLAGTSNGALKGTYYWRTPGVECPISGAACPNSAYMDFSKSGRMEVSDSAASDLADAGTVACWVYVDSFSNDYAGLVHKGDENDFSDEAYSLQFMGSRALRFIITKNGGQQNYVETGNLSTDRWYHVAATWNNTSLNIYLNGVLIQSKSNSYSARNSGGKLFIGSQLSSSSYYLDGRMDEIYLYKRALNATEVASLANANP